MPRHEKMVRLTGRHPFNVEAPLPVLWDRGFLTPASLHYVRNHGAVPKIAWSEHRLTVDGMVGAPKTFTMDDLLAMPARELPVSPKPPPSPLALTPALTPALTLAPTLALAPPLTPTLAR